MFIAPWFRGDWAYGEPLIEGAEVFLEHEGFRSAAQEMFEDAVIVPQIVYVNLNPPIAQVDPGHVDIPAFRGIDRTKYPVWLLKAVDSPIGQMALTAPRSAARASATLRWSGTTTTCSIASRQSDPMTERCPKA